MLRRVDQTSCVGLAMISLVAMGTCWIYQGGLQGRLIDVDTAPHRPVPFQIEINSAPWQEWSVLPGIGERLAKRIVASREEHGPFQSPEDLLRVPGIGPIILERLKPFLRMQTPNQQTTEH